MISSKTIFCARSAAWEILMSSRRFRTCSGRMVKCILCFALSFFRRTYIILVMAKKLLAFYAAVWHWLRLEASCRLTIRVLDVSPRLCVWPSGIFIRNINMNALFYGKVLKYQCRNDYVDSIYWSQVANWAMSGEDIRRTCSLAQNNRSKIS